MVDSVDAAAASDAVNGMATFDRHESSVRYYCRRWPTVFARAQGCHVWAEDGTRYLDLFAGAGSMNLGHNQPEIVDEMVRHLRNGGLLNSLDMATVAKRDFLRALVDVILDPRGFDYRVQFTGPSGADAVEAALRLVRKVTGRQQVIALSGAFHGMTLGSRGVSDPGTGRATSAGGVVTRVPHEMDHDHRTGAIDALRRAFRAHGEPPAGVILEVVQAEGGVRPLSNEYLTAAAALCREHESLLVVDDIQAGCGRTGPYFSFEPAGLRPDVVCLSKSIGAGLPLGLLLLAPEVDVWRPGEHTGTFRGSALAFVAGRVGLERWWRDARLPARVRSVSDRFVAALAELADRTPWLAPPRARGLMIGLPCASRAHADALAGRCFDGGLLVETCGREGSVLKLLPPLTVADDEVGVALAAIEQAARWITLRCR
jgi:diaminobutyrate-2-oxoglutarate transaminase